MASVLEAMRPKSMKKMVYDCIRLQYISNSPIIGGNTDLRVPEALLVIKYYSEAALCFS